MNNEWVKAEILIIKGGGKSQFQTFKRRVASALPCCESA